MKTKDVLKKISDKYSSEPEFLQAVTEFFESIEDLYDSNSLYQKNNILERVATPDRIFTFQVAWVDDNGDVQVNVGYRVQFNNAIGPYKGGLRFHPSVNISILKFLGFEQIFKNSLTTLPMGGGKGGSDFNPKGKSDGEIMRFCQAFMLKLWQYIGENTDVPAGDIGVGKKEIGYLFGMYKQLTHSHVGVITGKGLDWGGSRIRPEATGYGVVYFAQSMLETKQLTIENKTIAISGFGNVAWGVAKKAHQLGAKVITLSGPDGYVYVKNGLQKEHIEYMLELRAKNLDEIKPFSEKFNVPYFKGLRPWEKACDIAIPCATQNELDAEDAKKLLLNNCICIVEAANMPCTLEAQKIIHDSKILYSPGKASNAGGVAVSGLEMSQNSVRYTWSAEGVDDKLRRIMAEIHESCVSYGKTEDGYIDYVKGANIAGFIKVANAMCELGV